MLNIKLRSSVAVETTEFLIVMANVIYYAYIKNIHQCHLYPSDRFSVILSKHTFISYLRICVYDMEVFQDPASMEILYNILLVDRSKGIFFYTAKGKAKRTQLFMPQNV